MVNYPVKLEIKNQILKDYHNNEKQNKPHNIKTTGTIKMTYNKETTPKNEKQIVETETWISHTKSGKGFIIVLEADYKKGTVLMGSVANLDKFVGNVHKGVKLSELQG